MEKLKRRIQPFQSKNKIVSAITLYEQYVDEYIDTIKIYSSTMYLINDKWTVNIATNKVYKCYPDPE
jgi:hypothetical protein